MTNREAYLQQLNELAATVVMGWRKKRGIPVWWLDTGGAYQRPVGKWQPCQNETQAWMLVDKVLAEAEDHPCFHIFCWKNWTHALFYESGAHPIVDTEDGARSVAITQAAIVASGGELPGYVEG